MEALDKKADKPIKICKKFVKKLNKMDFNQEDMTDIFGVGTLDNIVCHQITENTFL